MAPQVSDAFFDLYKKDLIAVYVDTRGCFHSIKEAIADFDHQEDEEDDYHPSVSDFLTYFDLPEDFSEYQGGEDEEDVDDWMEVYYQGSFEPYCGDHAELQAYKGFHYFQCWGGGPEGGYITNDDNEVYEVNRTWGQHFTVERVFFKIEMETLGGGYMHLRLRMWEGS